VRASGAPARMRSIDDIRNSLISLHSPNLARQVLFLSRFACSALPGHAVTYQNIGGMSFDEINYRNNQTFQA
jgi:hypothetical protein